MHSPFSTSQRGLRSRLLAIGWLLCSSYASRADDVPTIKYSDDVVSKAEKILGDVGLRRNGKTFSVAKTTDISRALSALPRSRRTLKLNREATKQTLALLSQIRKQSEMINGQNIDINLKLAQGGLDVTTHNQMVAMNNANVATIRQLATNQDRMAEKLATERKTLNDAEAAYAETVLAIRRDLNQVKSQLDISLEEHKDSIAIALKVLSTNFGTPPTMTTDSILATLDKRLKQIEQEIFNEYIILDVSPEGSLYLNVVIGDQTTRMVLDSGASLVCLPSEIATKLGIVVPPDAKPLRLVLADGREIPASAVTLPKIRVGQFEAENVEAAVLDAVATNAEPLLGMSFLGNFKFEIDTADKSLRLLRVADQ